MHVNNKSTNDNDDNNGNNISGNQHQAAGKRAIAVPITAFPMEQASRKGAEVRLPKAEDQAAEAAALREAKAAQLVKMPGVTDPFAASH